MAETQSKQSGILTLVLIVVGALILITIMSILKKQQTQQPVIPEITPAEEIAAPQNAPADEVTPAQPQAKEEINQAPPPKEQAVKETATLQEIARTADTWMVGHESWIGRQAPDFTFTDIAGKSHTLSGYRGKNVMIVLWGTWCAPCREEIPHLIALQKVLSDKLAVIAISIEKESVVKRFVDRNPRINYTVIAADESALPLPYGQIAGFPSAFYIDPEGKIKFATVGAMTLGTMRSIVTAPN